MSTPVPRLTTKAVLMHLEQAARRLRYLADNYGGAWPDAEAEDTQALADQADNALTAWHESEDALLEDMAAEHASICPRHNVELESGVCPHCITEQTEKHLLQNDEAREEN